MGYAVRPPLDVLEPLSPLIDLSRGTQLVLTTRKGLAAILNPPEQWTGRLGQRLAAGLSTDSMNEQNAEIELLPARLAAVHGLRPGSSITICREA
jgi:hypothetical protein